MSDTVASVKKKPPPPKPSSTSSHVKAKLHQCKLQLEHDLRLMRINHETTVKINKAETRHVMAFLQNLQKHSGNDESTMPPSGSDSSSSNENKPSPTTTDGKVVPRYRCNPKMEFGTHDYHEGLTSRLAQIHYCRSHFDPDYVIENYLKKKKLAWPQTR